MFIYLLFVLSMEISRVSAASKCVWVGPRKKIFFWNLKKKFFLTPQNFQKLNFKGSRSNFMPQRPF